MKKKYKNKKFDRRIILEILAELGESTVENLLNTCLSFPTTFFRKISLNEAISPPEKIVKLDWVTRVKFLNLISRLKRDGLVKGSKENSLKLSGAGKHYITKYPSQNIRYKKSKNTGNNIILAIFDIPERYRQYRDWLRFQLKDLGFSFLQNSVWYNTREVPVELIKDLEKYKLLPYIHILSVNKQGTLSDWFKQIGRGNLSK